jgi:hypothetical protein
MGVSPKGDKAILLRRGPRAPLPEAEREPWRKLWADVDALLKRALDRVAPELDLEEDEEGSADV